MEKEILKLNKISKVYENGIVANKNINLIVNEGEIHAIVGENGAGKSTLMKMIFGMEKPTTGEYFLNNELVKLENVEEAINKGIGMVHQHFMLVDSLSVVDNIILGVEPVKGLFLDNKKSIEVVKNIAEKYKFNLDYEKKVSEISIGMKQKVEIIKALIRGAKIIILDEPTAVLTPQETRELFSQIKYLSQNGHTIIFISHKLNEVKEISDKVTIIRKGETKGTFLTKDISISEIANLMVGKKLNMEIPIKEKIEGKNVLEIRNLNLQKGQKKKLSNINLDVSSGEILGVIGVEGNGQADLVKILSLLEKDYEGYIKIFNKNINQFKFDEYREFGVSFVPEDRMRLGISETMSISDNLISTRYKEKNFSGKFLLKKNNIENYSKKVIEEYNIICKTTNDIVGYLSGGNIQKVVVGRECFINPKFLICEQPTRGVDLGAANIIHKKLIDLRNNGTSILLFSADINEILKISDRCIVMFDGKIVAKLDNLENCSINEIGEFMLGLKSQNEEGKIWKE